jgi:signal peptidase I
MTEITLWLALPAILLVVTTIGLRLGSAVACYQKPAWWQAAATAVAIYGWCVIAALGVIALGGRVSAPWYPWVLLSVVLMLVGGVLILKVGLWLPSAQVGRAALALAFSVTTALGLAYLPIVFTHRAFRSPANAMAPTLRGPHRIGVCPLCNGDLVLAPNRQPGDELEPAENERLEGICANCFQTSTAWSLESSPRGADRFVVRYLPTPRRWDIVAYRYPQDRSQLYLHRLVGLPGESIEIKEGAIWIDGVRLEPPPEIAGLRWLAPQNGPEAGFAAPERPTRLAENEYFVIGDFSTRSSDSRYWGPVNEDDLVGVVGAVYFPPRSARIMPRR